MALCKELSKVRASGSTVFDKLLRVGTEALYEGIYRCVGCNMEIAVAGGKALPTPRQRPHPAWCTEQRWQLLVSTAPAREPGG